jgi:hypothetical protein
MFRLGKLSLWLNLALAVFFAIWGFGLYSNRMDWKAESTERSNQLRKLGGEISKMVPEVQATRPLAGKQDERRPQLNAWYAAQLENLRSGKDKPKALVYNKAVLQYDAKGLPALGEVLNSSNQPINGLASIDSLDQQYAAVQAQIGKAIEEERKNLTVETGQTVEVNGDGALKGLRGDLAAKEAAEKKSLERQEYLMPLLYNRQAELEILTKRKEGLDARLKELQGSKVDAP